MIEVDEIKLEVGQVWHTEHFAWHVLDLFILKGVPQVAHKCTLKYGVFSNVGHCEELYFLDGNELITNADGTPYLDSKGTSR